MERSDYISNDTRGWILCLISAIACVAGGCIVCVDVFIRLLPGKKNFRIEDSSAFLSSSLSLSFGVMIFSSLFSMLPSSKRYLLDDGQTDQVAGLLMIGGFALGFVGMQVISRIIHRFMPSHVVDCDHSHDEDVEADGLLSESQSFHQHAHPPFHSHDHHHDHSGTQYQTVGKLRVLSRPPSSAGPGATESTPLLHSGSATATQPLAPGLLRQLSSRSDGIPVVAGQTEGSVMPRALQNKRSMVSLRRPSMVEVRNRVISFVKDVKSNCDDLGPCYGYTDPCGQECKRVIAIRAPALVRNAVAMPSKVAAPATAVENGTESGIQHPDWESSIPVVPEESGSSEGTPRDITPLVVPDAVGTVRRYQLDASGHEEMQEADPEIACPPSGGESSTNVSNYGTGESAYKDLPRHAEHSPDHEVGVNDAHDSDSDLEVFDQGHASQQHHHHVPANAFMSIGLQTVLAIGLHKFPEGFITFATNHANPALGFNVFMALFVHNIAEGFAMALPLYMALGSRLKAIGWAAALGGLSQPLGAGAAALWIKYLGHKNSDEGGTAYGILFAVTAGIMVAVALQLFVESLTLHHNRQLSIAFAFLGMMLLGLSNAFGTH